MQKRLLTEGDVKLDKCIEIAQSMEAVHKDTRALKPSCSELTVGKVMQTSRAFLKHHAIMAS